jgi:predicted nucleic acid-binding protein
VRGISHRQRRYALVDTSAYFALTDPREQHHERARAIADRLGRERWRLFTTNFILAETHALLLTTLNRPVAARILAEIDRSPTTIVRVSAADEERAREIITRYQDKDFSLTDAASFAVMERLGIDWAFSLDRNLSQYGLSLLAPDRP